MGDEYKYFVSFFVNSDSNSWCFSYAEIIRKEKINSFNDLVEIAHSIEKENEKFKKVTILNYILLDYTRREKDD